MTTWAGHKRMAQQSKKMILIVGKTLKMILGRQKVMTHQLRKMSLEKIVLAAEKALLTTGKPTPNMLQFKQLENEIYTCALVEDNIPQYILLDDEFEVLAYPDMIPYGKGGYMISGECTTKLSLQKYYQQWLLNVDGCFANNIEYLFCAQYATGIKQIKDSTQIALHLKHGKTLGGRQLPQVC